MANRNQEIIERLRELAELTILDEGSPQSFRVRAYENAIVELEGVRDDLAAMTVKQLTALDGVGASTAKKIREYFDGGSIAKLEDLRAKYPPAFLELARIPGLGPKTLHRLRAELGIEDLDGLRGAIERQELRHLKGLGAKTEDKLARAIERMGGAGKHNRTPIGKALPLAERLVAALDAMADVKSARYCGSLRRFRETIGDIDIVVAATSPAPIMAWFTTMPEVREVLAHGDTKSSVLTDTGLQVDLRVVEPSQFGAATLYFTGSKAHNIKLRQRAIDRGWTLNEYALSDAETGDVVAAATEQAIYEALELGFIPEPMREDTGEVEAAAAGELPALITADRIRGDLHVHTDRSGDAHSSLAEVVAAAAARGYAYLAITDHGEDLAMNGVSRDELLAQRDEIAALQETYPKLRILWGCELNIGPDGGLDYDEELRMQLDWCIAGVHSHFDLDRAAQTRRIITALEDPSVHAIAHLSGRIIGERPGIELDIDAVLEAAAETGTAIEINAGLARLDATDAVLRRARDLDVTFTISTDAHHCDRLGRMGYGVLHAQRGWVENERVANAKTVAQFERWAQSVRG